MFVELGGPDMAKGLGLDLLMTIIIAIIIEFFGLSVIANNPQILVRILEP